MGRKWFCDDEFRYPTLSKFTLQNYVGNHNTTRVGLRRGCLTTCVGQCQSNGVRIPKQCARVMQHDTPQQLELVLFHAREEENRMRMRLNIKDMLDNSRAFANEGDYHNAKLYHHYTTSVDYYSDCFMFDDE